MEVEKIWLSNAEAAAYMGTSSDYLKSLRDNGLISFYKPYGNKMIFYLKQDIDNFIKKGKVI